MSSINTLIKKFLHKDVGNRQLNKDIGSSFMVYHPLGQAIATPKRYEDLCHEGYRQNVIVFRCIHLIARSAASVPWRLLCNGQQLQDHPLLDLMHRPNPRQGGAAFIESLFAYWLLSGNSYIERVEDAKGMPRELYALRP
ncbi:MAG: phage portal protein, partial [Bacteroidota bacterium]